MKHVIGNLQSLEEIHAAAIPDLTDLIPEFCQDRYSESLKLEQFLVEGDFESIKKLGHNWKGFCAPYGFKTLEMFGILLEENAINENRSELSLIVSEVVGYLEVLNKK